MSKPSLALKLASSVIASGVTLLIGFNQFALAQDACGLSDASRFHQAVAAPTEEGSPAYFLRVAEEFLAACPDRLEVREAHLIAARAALDLGDAAIAAQHYDAAIAAGASLDPSTRMDQSVALLALGRDAHARAARNIAIADWLTGLERTGTARLSYSKSRDGTIYAVRYDTPDRKLGVEALWIAVPKGPGLPSSVLIRPDAQRAAWRSLRTGGEVTDLIVAEEVRCRTSRVVTEVIAEMTPEELKRPAMTALEAYLKAPDTVEPTGAGEPLAACTGLDRMLYTPALTETAMLR